jgi:hypothetical protein
MIGVTIVTKDPHLARSLWDRGWPVTAQSGRGESGPVTVLSVPVNRRDETRLHGDVQRIAPDAVCTTRDLRAPNSAYQSGPPSSRSRRTGWIRTMSAAALRMASSSRADGPSQPVADEAVPSPGPLAPLTTRSITSEVLATSLVKAAQSVSAET